MSEGTDSAERVERLLNGQVETIDTLRADRDTHLAMMASLLADRDALRSTNRSLNRRFHHADKAWHKLNRQYHHFSAGLDALLYERLSRLVRECERCSARNQAEIAIENSAGTPCLRCGGMVDVVCSYGNCQSCCPGPNYHNDTTPWEAFGDDGSDDRDERKA